LPHLNAWDHTCHRGPACLGLCLPLLGPAPAFACKSRTHTHALQEPLQPHCPSPAWSHTSPAITWDCLSDCLGSWTTGYLPLVWVLLPAAPTTVATTILATGTHLLLPLTSGVIGLPYGHSASHGILGSLRVPVRLPGLPAAPAGTGPACHLGTCLPACCLLGYPATIAACLPACLPAMLASCLLCTAPALLNRLESFSVPALCGCLLVTAGTLPACMDILGYRRRNTSVLLPCVPFPAHLLLQCLLPQNTSLPVPCSLSTANTY